MTYFEMLMELLNKNSGAVTTLATIILVIITAFYAYWTRGILRATSRQSRLSLNPVVGIEVKKITIGEMFGERQRRHMGVDLLLTNVGNAPAISVYVDGEITLRHSNIDSHKVIPMRFEPDLIPFIKSGDEVGDLGLSFGNSLITHFFDDVRECLRLNLHRIATDPTRKSHRASRLRIIVYYRNSLGQHFKSIYEIEIGIILLAKAGEIPGDGIPNDDESVDVQMFSIPRPIFHSTIFDEKSAKIEIDEREKIRGLCGW
jgi:hypothetical protein